MARDDLDVEAVRRHGNARPPFDGLDAEIERLQDALALRRRDVDADQPAGRVFVIGSMLGPVRATGLSQTRVAMQANPGIATLTLDGAMSVTSIGAGGIGPVVLDHASRLLMSDTWYEGRAATLFDVRSGEMTYLGGHAGPADPVHGGGPVAPRPPGPGRAQ